MLDKSYQKKCEDLLRDFEKTQLRMLQLDLRGASESFLIQLKEMRQFFRNVATEFADYSFESERDKTLLIKQIERLLVFLKEMDLHLTGFESKVMPDENEIIFIFERQHLFKNIYRKHITDYATIIEK
jgi:hypothetical protein